MASIGNDPNGHKRILFKAGDGRRRTVRLGKVTLKLAEQIKRRVEALNAAGIAGQQPDEETCRWLKRVDRQLLDKLIAVGLATSPDAKTLQAFCSEYIAGRTDVKPGTVSECYEPGRDNLVAFFGPDAELRSITRGQADEYYIWLKSKYAAATASRRLKTARQFFRAALRRTLIDANVFDDVKPAGQDNRARDYFVSPQEIQLVLEACPCPQWRAIIALARFGGLRCPSEVLALEWSAVDWENQRIHVASPKTEHHAGKESRTIPLFPELRPYLEALFFQPGTERYVITRYRDAAKNLRTQMLRWIRQAGLEVWPRVFQNLRASRETELAAEYPLHVVTAWIGNSVPVAAKHYLQVRESDYAKAAQNPAQQRHATGGNGGQRPTQEMQKPLENPHFPGLNETASWPPRIRTLTN